MGLQLVQWFWIGICLVLGLFYVGALRPRKGSLEWIVGRPPVFSKRLSWKGTWNRQDVLLASAIGAGVIGVWIALTFLFVGQDLVWDFSQIYWFFIFQVVLPGAAAAVVYFLFRGLYESRFLGLLAAFYVATCPTDDMGASLTLALVFLLMLQYWDRKQPLWWQYVALGLCGTTVGVGAYFYPLFSNCLLFLFAVVAGKGLGAWCRREGVWKHFLLSLACLLGAYAGTFWLIHIPMGLAMNLPIFSEAYLFLLQATWLYPVDLGQVVLRLALVWPMHWSWLVPFGLGYLVALAGMLRQYGPRTMMVHWYLILLLALWLVGGVSAMALATMLGLCHLLVTLKRRGYAVMMYIAAALLVAVRIAIAWLWLI